MQNAHAKTYDAENARPNLYYLIRSGHIPTDQIFNVKNPLILYK